MTDIRRLAAGVSPGTGAAGGAGLDARGGQAGRKYGNQREKTPLGTVMRLGLTHEGAKMRLSARNKRKGYFLRAETLFGFAEVASGLPGYWGKALPCPGDLVQRGIHRPAQVSS